MIGFFWTYDLIQQIKFLILTLHNSEVEIEAFSCQSAFI